VPVIRLELFWRFQRKLVKLSGSWSGANSDTGIELCFLASFGPRILSDRSCVDVFARSAPDREGRRSAVTSISVSS
jgi:hypothetical protein